MIVRIAGDNQFRLDATHEARLTELDGAVLRALEGGDEQAFDSTFATLLDFVRATGTPLAADALDSSDLILPPDDTSLAEAVGNFTGEGWLPE